MAHGFVQSFDQNLTVRSAGTEPALQVNRRAVAVMREVGIEIGSHVPTLVDQYLNETWDFVITVCDHANEVCPFFSGKVKNRLHMGFEDPSHAIGTEDFIMGEFRRIRDAIKVEFYNLYVNQIKPLI
jgi:arsenate reductase